MRDISLKNENISGLANISHKNTEIAIEWLTTSEAAMYLKISPKTLYNLTSNGKVKYHKFGRRNRYKKNDLNHLIEIEQRG